MDEGRGKKGQINNSEIKNKKIYIFIRQTKLKHTYNGLLDVESVARDSWSPLSVHG